MHNESGICTPLSRPDDKRVPNNPYERTGKLLHGSTIGKAQKFLDSSVYQCKQGDETGKRCEGHTKRQFRPAYFGNGGQSLLVGDW
jgi:hypothetical protein